MRLCVTVEHRFDQTPDGQVHAQAGYTYAFWQRYLEVFDEVRVIARMQVVDSVPGDWKRCDGPGVSFVALPYFVGPVQYALKFPSVLKGLYSSIGKKDAILMRVPSQLANTLTPYLRLRGHPYGVEIVGDPLQAFSKDAVDHPLRAFFRWLFAQSLRTQCANACATAYVTRETLQKLYPPSAQAFSTYYSSIRLTPEAVVQTPRTYEVPLREAVVICVGSMEMPYKGQDVLIEAADLCRKQGITLNIKFLGDGATRPRFEALTRDLKLEEQIDFIGSVAAGEGVREWLRKGDLFVMPSRTEGLPRAMVEAMAQGLPCLGSDVGGIPEQLDPEERVPVGDPQALANAIMAMLSDPQRMTKAAAQNLERSREYMEDLLSMRRFQFYKAIREQTESWLAGS